MGLDTVGQHPCGRAGGTDTPSPSACCSPSHIAQHPLPRWGSGEVQSGEQGF